ncbi:MAG: carbon-nitrogen hydrolase family protein [Gracilibacteraceae bacterium]|jgi:predicted amidohydrolase|nr:carbon-nitrogen hydrolase family protein [Gracilibacteraceae bacterium]
MMKLGLVQMPVTADKEKNIRTAERYIASCAADGADIVVLPEMFCCPLSPKYYAALAEERGGPAWRRMAAAADRGKVWLVAGSLPEREGKRLYNTAFVFDPAGREAARHRKLHMFDLNLPGQETRESDIFTPGAAPTLFDTPWRRCGLCVCFDLRFPELALRMALGGAELIIAPAVFSAVTGAAHWETLLRQRAVDNQLFMAAVSAARGEKGFVSHAHSMVTGPWGDILYEAGTEETAAVVSIDFEEVRAVREKLPLLSARRPELY